MNTAVRVLTVLFTLYAGLYLVQEFTKVDVMCRIGDIWSLLDLDDEGPGIFTSVDPEDFPEGPVPEPGDSLLSVDGLTATVSNYFTVFSTDTPAGREVGIVYREPSRISMDSTLSSSMAALLATPIDAALGTGIADSVSEGEGWMVIAPPPVSTTVVTRSIPPVYKVQIILLFIARVLITAGFLYTAAYTLARRPGNPAARVMALFCLAITSLMVFSTQIIPMAYATFRLPFQDGLLTATRILGAFSASFWLHLHMLFPFERERFTKHRKVALAAIYIPIAALVAFNFFIDGQEINIVAVPVLTCYFAGGFAMLRRAMSKSAGMLERREARMVMWGAAPGFIVFMLIAWIQLLFAREMATLSYTGRLLIANIQFLSILPAPLSIARAMGRFRLHDAETKYRKGTLFLIVNVFLLAFIVVFAYGAGRALSSAAGIGGTTPVLLISLSLAVGFAPVQRIIRNDLENRFFPERRRLRALLSGFLQEIRGIGDRGEFWSLLARRLTEGLDAEPVIPVTKAGASSTALTDGSGAPAPFDTEDMFVQRLCSEGRPLLLDELQASGRIPLDPAQTDWFEARRIALLLPLPSRDGSIGFVAAGRKRSGEDYRAFELETLGSLSGQMAIAAENIELMEEKVEKEKLEEQLSIARSIQKGLLPGEIPDTPGLSVSASIQFCLEVAGDYYDVIPMSGGRTLLALGDATGKGVGPALLMANLQATLRSISDVGIPLEEMVARANRMVHANTSPEYFITMFAAVFDPCTSTLEWVNAGHNPPVLLGAGGGIFELSEGGLLLGVSRDAGYRSGTVRMEHGDLLVMYSDGLTEAMDASGEEYGPERLAGAARSAAGLETCMVVREIVSDVRRFHGSDSFRDDFTIMVARRL